MRINYNKIPIFLLEKSITKSSFEDIKINLQIKKNTKTVQLFQILKYLWTIELQSLLIEIGYKDIIHHLDKWIPKTYIEDKVCYVEIVGMDNLLLVTETRDFLVKKLLRGEVLESGLLGQS